MSPLHPIRLLIGAALVALALGAPAGAQEVQEISPDHLALARKYVDLTDSAKLYEQAVVAVAVQATRTLVSQSPDLADPISDAAIAIMQEYEDRKDELFDQFSRIYAIHFNPEELIAIIAFYETDVGKRLVAQNPAINQELTLALEVYRTNLSNEFMLQLRARLAEAGYTF
ncbi:MAG: DUF2059 domain-containing protein [Cucumibacter sp.]